jgi:hypothetical protein
MNASSNCRNCGAGLAGRYCSSCGQSADVHVPSTRELLHEVLEDLTHSDSRLWATLKCLLFKPGKLTQEFVAGRRVAYLPPFRLYLIMSVAFFLTASFSHFNTQVVRIDKGDAHAPAELDCANGTIDLPFFDNNPAWQKRFQRACEGVVRDNGSSLLHVGVATMPKAMFIFLPLIAFLHMLMYWWPRYRYAVHLLFFLHVHAFFFFVALLIALSGDAAAAWPALTGFDDIASTLLEWWMIIYSIVALRRVFAMGWPLTLVKAFLLFFVYVIMLGLTLSIVFIYAALQL